MKRYREDVKTALLKLKAGQYKTIYMDPPWAWMRGGMKGGISARTGRETKNAASIKYKGMSTIELVALGPEIQRVVTPCAHLWLWSVNKTLPDAIKIIEAYGFRWTSMVTWDKQKPGVGKYLQGMTEHCIFAVRGSPPYKFVDGKMQQGRTLVSERATDHSRKPVVMRDMIERVSYGPYLELFGRRVPRNWSAIGDELEEL